MMKGSGFQQLLGLKMIILISTIFWVVKVEDR
jgi:hypothetical protein